VPRLPDHVTACLFDMDGVLTDTASVHARAWKQMFDAYLRERSERTGEPFRPFDSKDDYDDYVDGRPRYDGVRTFLESRGIELPEGSPSDDPGSETIDGLGNRKNELVLKLVHSEGVHAYPGSIRYVKAVRAAGLKTALVSSSANAREFIGATEMADELDAIVDGVYTREHGLAGKPAPDTYLAAARELGVPKEEAAVFEDALAGVESGRAGAFGCVVGVDRVGQANELREHGADIVVRDLAELLES
jgi:beta-phosphoglucomutase family hydrolase